MIDLQKLAKNPAYAISAMLYGLQNPIETEDVKYEVDMSTFGRVKHDGTMTMCYGCAATSTLEVITGHSLAEKIKSVFTGDNTMCTSGKLFDRAKLFDTSCGETNYFEGAIDMARRGSFSTLMGFFGHDYDMEYDRKYDDDGSDLLYMTSLYWEDAVPSFEKLIEIMHENYPDWERFKEPGDMT